MCAEIFNCEEAYAVGSHTFLRDRLSNFSKFKRETTHRNWCWSGTYKLGESYGDEAKSDCGELHGVVVIECRDKLEFEIVCAEASYI